MFGNLVHKAANSAVLKKFVPKKTLNQVHDYWRSQVDGPNAYSQYINGEERSFLLLDEMNKLVDKNALF